jgi:hypothetical protein
MIQRPHVGLRHIENQNVVAGTIRTTNPPAHVVTRAQKADIQTVIGATSRTDEIRDVRGTMTATTTVNIAVEVEVEQALAVTMAMPRTEATNDTTTTGTEETEIVTGGATTRTVTEVGTGARTETRRARKGASVWTTSASTTNKVRSITSPWHRL